MAEYTIYQLETDATRLENEIETIETQLIDSNTKQFRYANILYPTVILDDWLYRLELNTVVLNFDKSAGFKLLDSGLVEYWVLQ